MYTITALCRLTGTKPSTLRTWERRYGVPRPSRSENGRRMYGPDEVARISLLVRLTEAGHPIGDLATLSAAELERRGTELRTGDPGRGDLTLRERLLKAIEQRDFEAYRVQLSQALILLPPVQAADMVVAPVLRELGHAWESGRLSIAVEHLVSALTHHCLLLAANAVSWPKRTRTIVFTTPPDEMHELGAMLAWYVAASLGWNTIYLGPNLPLDACAEAITLTGADVLALSFVSQGDRAPLLPALTTLARTAAPCEIWLGAPKGDPLHKVPLPEGVVRFASLEEFYNALQALPGQPARKAS